MCVFEHGAAQGHARAVNILMPSIPGMPFIPASRSSTDESTEPQPHSAHARSKTLARRGMGVQAVLTRLAEAARRDGLSARALLSMVLYLGTRLGTTSKYVGSYIVSVQYC